MPDVIRDQIAGVVQRNEKVTARATVPVELGTAEAVTVTVMKPSGSSFAASAGTTLEQVYSTLYRMLIDDGDIDENGIVFFKLAGATDTTYVPVMVVEFDPFLEGAMSDLVLKQRISTPG